MEPDILASAGDPGTARETPIGANTIQSEGSPKVETPPDIPKARAVRLHSVTAHAPVTPRVRTHSGGFANGHARPRTAATGLWRTIPASGTVPAVLPFETPRPEGLYLRVGKRAI